MAHSLIHSLATKVYGIAYVTYSTSLPAESDAFLAFSSSEEPALGVVAYWSHASHQIVAEGGTKHAPIPTLRFRRHHGN